MQLQVLSDVEDDPMSLKGPDPPAPLPLYDDERFSDFDPAGESSKPKPQKSKSKNTDGEQKKERKKPRVSKSKVAEAPAPSDIVKSREFIVDSDGGKSAERSLT